MSEINLTEDDVRREHLESVSVPAHWAYLFGALTFGLILMLALIALLGGSSS